MSKPAPTELRINGELIEIDNLPALQAACEQARAQQFSELWLKGDKEDSLAILLNREHALLVYLRFPGDAGMMSRNSDYRGGADEKVEFLLAGACEQFPAAFVIAAADALRAAEHYYIERVPAPWINWHDNSGFLI